MGSIIRDKVRLYILIGLCVLCVLALVGMFVSARDDDRSPSVLGGGVGGDAQTIDTIDSTQFIRSDVTDSYTSGTLTISAGTTLQTEGNFYTKGSPVYNVMAYGAIGDGVIDDTVAIQAAIDAAKDWYNAGRVFFPKGNYVISSPIVIDRRVDLCGIGFGSQIYQSADDHLFYIDPYVGGAVKSLRMTNLHLGSAATTPGKALIFLNLGGSMWFENLNLYGGADGIYVNGSLFNTFRNINTRNAGFFGAAQPCDRWVYATSSGGVHCNGNRFSDLNLDYGDYGFYIEESGAQGNIHIEGCKMEQGNTYGIYISGSGGSTISDVHLEGAVPTCGIHLVNCFNTRITGKNYETLLIERSSKINVIGGTARSVTVDKFSRDITIQNVRTPSYSVDGTSIDARLLSNPNDLYYPPSGTSSRSNRNLVDGSMEVWRGGLPIGFGYWGTNSVYTAETIIKKFGSQSCKIECKNPGGGAATLTFALDYDRLAKLDLTNYRSSTYKWTASGSGTGEYYVELAAGGEPGIDVEPLKHSSSVEGGVLINDTWADKGALGALAVGGWGYGDNDSLGYNTIYVRITADADPDGQASGYVRGMHKLHAVTVSCWAYKPETNGADPELWQIFTGASGPTGGVHTIPTDEWTRIKRTFYTRPFKTSSDIQIGFRPTAAENATVYIDAVEIVEGCSPSPVYDDSRGLDGDFRVGGSFLRSGEVSAMAGHETFVWGDGDIFVKDPDGAARNFNPSGSFPDLAEITLINTADAAETITFDSAGLNQAVARFERGIFVYADSNWLKVYVGS